MPTYDLRDEDMMQPDVMNVLVNNVWGDTITIQHHQGNDTISVFDGKEHYHMYVDDVPDMVKALQFTYNKIKNEESC